MDEIQKEFDENKLQQSHHNIVNPENSQQIQGESSIYFSQFTQTLYLPFMNAIKPVSQDFIQSRLSNSGILYEKGEFFGTFTKSCAKTNLESTVYEVKYGYFKTVLKVIKMRLEPKLLFNKFLAKGNFAQVFKFQLDSKTYALKKINLALKQIFFAKLFSALQIGPKYYQLFSYDALIFKSSVYFAMEMCETNFTNIQIQKQMRERNLLNQLKLIHSLGICHMDLKLENIGWSLSRGKLVFLDFNLSVIIGEKIGYKTLFGFVGTYNYSSPEMRKLFFLKSQSYVDLYYNDFHCLQKIWEKLQFYRIQPKIENQLRIYNKSSKELKEFQQLQHCVIVRYFQLKFVLFQENSEGIKNMVEQQKFLVKTVRKVAGLLNQQLQTQIKDNNKSQMIHSQVINNKERLDQLFYQYEISKTDQGELNSLQFMLEVCESDDLFCKMWVEDVWKQKFFFFIDVYSNVGINWAHYRKKFINKIYEIVTSSSISHIQNPSEIFKLREILIFYLQYFKKQANISILQKILVYFLLFWDYQSMELAEETILLIKLSNKKSKEYLQDNLKYYIGKFVIFSLENNPNFSSNLTKVQNFLSNFQEGDSQFRQIAQNILEVMKLLKTIYLYHVKKQIVLEKAESLRQKIKLKAQDLGQQACQFIEILVNFRLEKFEIQGYNTIKETKLKFDNIFLQKCAFLLKIAENYSIHQTCQLQKLLNSQQLLREFITYSHYFASITIRSLKFQHIKLCQEYLSLVKVKSIFMNLNLLNSFLQTRTMQQFQDESLLTLQNFNLKQIKNVRQLLAFQNLIVISLSKYSSKINAQKFGQIILLFLQIISDFNLLKQSTLAIDNQDSFYILQSKYMEIYNYLKLIIFIRLDMENQVLHVLNNLPQQKQSIVKNQVIINFMLKRVNVLSQKIKQWILINLLTMGDDLVSNPCNQIFVFIPQLFWKILKIRIDRGEPQVAMKYIEQYCFFITRKKVPLLVSNVFIVMIKFAESTPTTILRHLIEKYSQNALLLSFAKFLLHSENIGFNEIRRRLTVICANSASYFTEGYFSLYRKDVAYETYQIKIKKSKRIPYIRKFNINTTLLINLKQIFLCIKNPENKLSRKKLQQKVQQIVCKLERKSFNYFSRLYKIQR